MWLGWLRSGPSNLLCSIVWVGPSLARTEVWSKLHPARSREPVGSHVGFLKEIQAAPMAGLVAAGLVAAVGFVAVGLVAAGLVAAGLVAAQ